MPFGRRQSRKTRRRNTRSNRRRRLVQRGGSADKPKWIILQYDNRQLSYEFKQLVKVNQNYARRHGYDYIFDSMMYQIPPYWIKVKLTYDLLKKRLPNGESKYKGVMFIDTDAVIVKPEVTLDTLTSAHKDFIAASDINYDLYPREQSIFNAGVFIVKNTPKAHAIFEDWLTVYETAKKHWVFNGTTWYTNGRWAGPVYEQGAFVEKIIPKHRAAIDLIDKFILQAEYVPQVEPIRPETFVIHFSHSRKNMQLPSFLQMEMPKLQQHGGGELPESQDFPDSGLTLVTSSDKWKPTLKELVLSCIKHRISYRVVGIGKPWDGFKTKMANYKQASEQLKREKGHGALLTFVDAYDCIVIKNGQAIVDSYRSKPRPMPIVVGVEAFCHDKCNPGTLAWFDKYIEQGISKKILASVRGDRQAPKPVFLNSGMILGPAGELSAMFSEMGMYTHVGGDDQLAACEFCIRHLDKVDLDIEQRIFRNKNDTQDKLANEGRTSGPGILHFPNMREDDRQAQLLEIYKRY